MKDSFLKSRGGYIALISVIVLTAIILVIVFTLGLGSFYGRMDILGSDFKEQSQALSEACLETARLNMLSDPEYAGNENVTVGSSTCFIGAITSSGTAHKLILTEGMHQNSYTSLRTTINASSGAIVGIEQLKDF